MKPRKYTSLSQFFHAKSSSRPDQILVYFEHGVKKEISFKSFYRLVSKKKKEYQASKIGSIAIIHSSSFETLVSMLGASLAGVRSAPISPFFPNSALKAMIKASCSETLEADEEDFDDGELLELRKALSPHEKAKKNQEGNFIYFTSGTSSFSKAVELSSRSFLDACYNGQRMLRCSKKDTILSLLPIEHVFGFVCSILWPLVYGANVVFSEGLAKAKEELSTYDPTILPLVPSLTKFLLSHDFINPGCKTILIGAGPINASDMASIEQKGIRLAFGYGLTETASGVAISVGGEDPLAMDFCPDDSFRIEKDGTVSIKCPYLMEGYFHNEEATRKVITPDGYLKTNDLAFIDKNKRLHILGRKDDIAILSNGTKIDCAEAEAGLLHPLPNLDFALTSKEGEMSFFFFPKNPGDKEAAEKAISDYNRHVSPARRIAGIYESLGPLPRTKTGKIQRYLLEGIATK